MRMCGYTIGHAANQKDDTMNKINIQQLKRFIVTLSALVIARTFRKMNLRYAHRISDFFPKSRQSVICLMHTVQNREKCKHSETERKKEST